MSKAVAPDSLPVKPRLVAGLDVGGTKVNILDTGSTRLHRYVTEEYSNVYEVLDAYFGELGSRPERVTIAMAGPRDERTGNIHLSVHPWPMFKPEEAARRYPGTTFSTLHDMGAVAAGMVYAPGLDLLPIKPGKPVEFGPKLAITISTGVGLCLAAWDAAAGRYFFFSGEGGHVGFQPYTEAEQQYLAHLYTKHEHPSVELAISGKYGIESWIEHSPDLNDAPGLTAALRRAVEAKQPTGAVLLEFAKHGQGRDQAAAASLLGHLGGLVGNVLADYALVYRSTGGIYLTGSVAMGLAEYWAEHTNFLKAFVRHGTADHAHWLESMLGDMPIYLIGDPNIGVVGALASAQQAS